MSLQCNLSLNYSAYTVGQTPPPMATLQVYNPNATAVVVTGIELTGQTLNDPLIKRINGLPAFGPGQTVSAPALSSINFGPFPVVAFSAANVNSFQMVNQTGNVNPVNPQGSQKPQTTLMLGARVAASDGSFNDAGQVALQVACFPGQPNYFLTQGGVLQLYAQNNSSALVLIGVL